METQWILNEISTGLQQLLCLSLERQPASELIAGTARAWHQALTTNRAWDEQRDTLRIRAAFVTLAQTRRTWPLPVDLIDALPKASEHLALPAKPADPEVADRARAEIAEELGRPPSWMGQGRTGMSSMSDAARELSRELDSREGRA